MPETQNGPWQTYYTDRINNHFFLFADYVETYPRAIGEDYSLLENEHLNILSAIENAISCCCWKQVVRFGWAVCDPTKGYLRIRGYWLTLNELLPQMIVAAQNAKDQNALHTFWQHYANMKLDIGDWETAEPIYHQLLNY